jgi:hypothetical protein
LSIYNIYIPSGLMKARYNSRVLMAFIIRKQWVYR